MSYTLDRVPTFLLYDGLSWCIKNKRDQANFFFVVDDVRDDVFATPDQIKTELTRRDFEELNPAVRCENCGGQADGRCHFVAGEELCSSCYWSLLKVLATGSKTPKKPNNVIVLHPVKRLGPPKETVKLEESREEIALRLGLPLEVLEDNGFFD